MSIPTLGRLSVHNALAAAGTTAADVGTLADAGLEEFPFETCEGGRLKAPYSDKLHEYLTKRKIEYQTAKEKAPPADADDFKDVKGKFEKYFSPKPGSSG